MEKVILGNTDIQVSRIGMGVMPIGPNQLSLPLEEGAKIVRYALEKGIDFLDTAQYYKTYPYIKKALADMGNTKDPVISSKSLADDYAGMMNAVEEARTSLDRDVIDIFLMHEIRSKDLQQRRKAWEALSDAKAKGLIRAMGISTHNIDVAMEAAGLEECDVVFPLINYAGLGIRKGLKAGSAEEMLSAIEKCKSAGKGIYAMKVFGGGNLTSTYQKALDYVCSQKCIDSIMIGFGSRRDIDDIVAYMDGNMPPDYNPDVSRKKLLVEQSNCEGCGTCMKMCQSNALFFNEQGLAEIDETKCLTCGYCAPVCPTRAIIMY